MAAALSACPNATMHLGAGVTAAENTASGVQLQLEDGRCVSGSLLIAADGVKSALREDLGIAFEGEDYASRVLRIFTDSDLAEFIPDIAPVSYLYDDERSVSVLKMTHGWRILFRIPTSQTDEVALRDGHIDTLLQDAFPPDGGRMHVVWKDVYTASRRVAERYRDGRIFLVGDAAHVTNTRGGMNMNCGIHDAYSLVDVVVRVLHCTAEESELESCARNRRMVAIQHLIPVSDRSIGTGAAWLTEIQSIAAEPAAARAYLIASSMLDIAPPRRGRAPT